MRSLFAVLISGFIFFIGCASKIVSIVDSANAPFTAIKAEGSTILPYTVGIVLNEEFKSKIARDSETYLEKEYIFEARLGHDMSRTLPVFFKKNFKEVVVLNHLNEAGMGVDYVFVPDISRSKAQIVVRMSPVPIYELTVSLKVNIFKEGHKFKFFNIVETKGMEVPRTKIDKAERERIVQEGYDKLMTRIYTNLGKALRQL